MIYRCRYNRLIQKRSILGSPSVLPPIQKNIQTAIYTGVLIIQCTGQQFLVSIGITPFLLFPFFLIQRMQLPGGNGVRIDSGYATGDEISPYYDSMVLKLICYADDRDEAIRQSLAALGELTIDGIEHNTELARAMLADPDCRSGNVHTKWIEHTFLPRFLRGHT